MLDYWVEGEIIRLQDNHMMPDDWVWTTNHRHSTVCPNILIILSLSVCMIFLLCIFFLLVVGLQLSLLWFCCHIHKVSVYISCARQHARHCLWIKSWTTMNWYFKPEMCITHRHTRQRKRETLFSCSLRRIPYLSHFSSRKCRCFLGIDSFDRNNNKLSGESEKKNTSTLH